MARTVTRATGIKKAMGKLLYRDQSSKPRLVLDNGYFRFFYIEDCSRNFKKSVSNKNFLVNVIFSSKVDRV